MEEEHCPARAKYLAAAVLSSCDAIKKGSEPFQSFNDLYVLRDAIVHPYPVSPDTRDAPAKVVGSLVQRRIARPAVPRKPGELVADTWWTQIRTPEVARWAAISASAIMLTLAESLVAIGDIGSVLKSSVTFLQSPPYSGRTYFLDKNAL